MAGSLAVSGKWVGRLGSGLAVGLVAVHFLLSAATLAGAGRPALGLTLLVALWAGAMAFSRQGLRLGLTLLGFGLFLFGWQSYVYPAVVFGLAADAVALALAWRNVGQARGGEEGTGPTSLFLAGLTVLALASTLLLPWGRFWRELVLFGPTGFFGAMVFSPADAPAYGLASAWRLAVFAVLARELARLDLPDRFPLLARGVAGGLLTAIVFGLYEHFQGDHYLLHYRFTSLFANPGWFAEYVAVAMPCLLVPLSRRSWRPRAVAAGGLALCGAALVLTLARAGWIVGCLTFGAAFLLYFRPNRLVRFDRPHGHLPTLAVAGLLVVGLSFWGAGRELSAISRPINALLAERVGNFTDSPRPGLFRAGLCIAAEGPVFGLGFETYARNYPVLLATPGSWLNRFGDQTAEVFETSHNMYVQLVSGLGLVGLGLWLALAGRAGWVLWRRARDYASLPDAAWLLSLIAFHIYAFFQEMFYVPPVLFLFFLPLARAMALEGRACAKARGSGDVGKAGMAGKAETDGRSRAERRFSWLTVAVWGLIVAGAAAYGADAGLWRTAARLGLAEWRAPGGAAVFEGFYPSEAADGGTFRWSAGDAVILAAPGQVALTLAAAVPTEVAFFTDAGPLDVVRCGTRAVTRRYVLPETPDGRSRPVFVVPGRTFLPQAATGAPDPRRLGVAIGIGR